MPKRILALDGGGLRGILSLGILQRIETILRQRHGNSGEFRLSHYFDLIAGTSTGAIIAAILAMGWTVEAIRQKYMELGDLGTDRLSKNSILSYLRYDADLRANSVQDLDPKLTDSEMIESLSDMDAPVNMEVLHELGVRAAKSKVNDDHFAARFNLLPV